jgi:hypothetical protein
MYRSMRSFLRDAQHNRLLAVPAGLYAVNNYLKFAMQLYFKPTTAKMLGNLKVPIVLIQSAAQHSSQFFSIRIETRGSCIPGIEMHPCPYRQPCQQPCV